ncbi:MAG TPA: hypothetical protein VD978_16050 [Azospirillum sp.]|nr:hypothetical protein [Azospirillum sp.]
MSLPSTRPEKATRIAGDRIARNHGADDLKQIQAVAYWKFVTGALFFSACSLLPTLLQ